MLSNYAISILLYRSDGWTVSLKLKRRLEAKKMCFYRRLLRIPWTELVNFWFLRRIIRKEGLKYIESMRFIGKQWETSQACVNERQKKRLGRSVKWVEDNMAIVLIKYIFYGLYLLNFFINKIYIILILSG